MLCDEIFSTTTAKWMNEWKCVQKSFYQATNNPALAGAEQ
jgi:hypothetical protein